jgi:hypothetical protein
MDSQDFENNIREYAKLVNVPKAVSEFVKYWNRKWKEANRLEYNDPGYGSTVGNITDKVLSEHLTNNSELEFTKGNVAKDEDCVCVTNAFYNTEIKTTCSPEQMMRGASTNAVDVKSNNPRKYFTDDYHFYIFIAFNRPQTSDDKLTVANIWIGMMRPSDWSTSKTNRSSGAYVKKCLFNKQFINVKDLY